MRSAVTIVVATLVVGVVVERTGRYSGVEATQGDQPQKWVTILVDDVSKYLKQTDVPVKTGEVPFLSDGKVKTKDGRNWIEASYSLTGNEFRMSYSLTAAVTGTKLPKEIRVADLAEVSITYTDDLMDAKGLTEKDVEGLIDQLRQSKNKVKIEIQIVPGGEFLGFSSPMKKLICLGEKARAPLLKCLEDQRIRNEAAVVLGAIGDEATVPLLIELYPEDDLRILGPDKPKQEARRLRVVCMTYALTYLTGEPIGRTRRGTDFNPENRRLWQEWWTQAGPRFKVPIEKPNATWVPCYPDLTEEGARKLRTEFATIKAHRIVR